MNGSTLLGHLGAKCATGHYVILPWHRSWSHKEPCQCISHTCSSSGGTAPSHLWWMDCLEIGVTTHHSAPLTRLLGASCGCINEIGRNVAADRVVSLIGVDQVVVKDNACLHHIHSLLWMELKWPPENPPPCSQDSKRIFYDPPGSGESVVKNALLSA